jgi:protein-tyrosine kinase
MSQTPSDTLLRAMESSHLRKSGDPSMFDRLGMDDKTPAKRSAAQSAMSQAKLGEILVQMNVITEEDQEKVYKRQEETGKPFGECALQMGLVTEKQLEQALGLQFSHQAPVKGGWPMAGDAVQAHEPFSSFSESMRTVASRLMSKWWKPGNKTVAVVSAEPREGRSHVAANLAIATAQLGYRTLLIDANLRRPRQHEIFKLQPHPGLSRILCGVLEEETIRRVPFLDNLTLITAGAVPPNTTELLVHDEFAALLKRAQRSFDIVIIDTPAYSGRDPDAEIIAKAAGSALLVGVKNRSRIRALTKIRERLKHGNVQIAGMIMNAAP